MGKGSKPRPLSVSREQFANSFDAIFGKKKPDAVATDPVAKTQCWCYNCLHEIKDDRGWPLTISTFIVCPDCGNKRCPRATDHNQACTNSNEPGQPGSRYQ